MESRRELAQTARRRLTPAVGYGLHPHRAGVAAELRLLADELEDGTLTLDLLSAVRCRALLNDYARSPLLNDALPAEDTGSWIRRVRLGFDRTEPA